MSREIEAELIVRCRQGDSDAWDALFDQHYPAVGRLLYQWGPEFSREDVEDICQEVFLAAIRHVDSFRGNCQFQTWLFRIATNKARDYRERLHAAKRGGGKTIQSLQAEDPATGLAIDPPSATPPPDAQLAGAEQAGMVREALERLGDPCREILDLRYFGDLSYEEIGAALKLNQKTVSSRLSKCLDRLEDAFQRLAAQEKRGKTPPFSVQPN